MVKIGIIGGSGLENPKILAQAKEMDVTTPYGKPSSPLVAGKIGGTEVVLLSRHGRNHGIMPTDVNSRANIHALKEIGVTHIIATTACGSLREEIKPGDFVFLDQFIDRTTKRPQTFFDKGTVAHIPMAEPFCPMLRAILKDTAVELGIRYHASGTVVTIEGPRFSTRAESNMFRMWNCDVVNMSTVPEVVLAREAGICYAAVAMSTDYDCWHDLEEAVDIAMVLKTFRENAERVVSLIRAAVPRIKENDSCRCRLDIKSAVIK